LFKGFNEGLITESVISEFEAKEANMIGPFWYGTTADIADKIRVNGFKIMVNKPTAERSANPMGEDEGDEGWEGPIHPFGFGVYLCLKEADAMEYADSPEWVLTCYLDVDRSDISLQKLVIEDEWMDFWIDNGYNTDATSINERFQETKELTENLKKNFPVYAWRRTEEETYLKDVSQVCVFDPDLIKIID
jgi:hypothetical protein